MNKIKAEQVHALMERLSEEIKLARQFDLHHTTRLLEMAKLDLQMIVYSISDEELRTFTHATANVLEVDPGSFRNGRDSKLPGDGGEKGDSLPIE